jgi:hypothetical protein
MAVVDAISLCGFTISSGMGASFSEVISLVISDKVLTNNVADVHEMKWIGDEKPSTLPTMFCEARDRKDASSMV